MSKHDLDWALRVLNEREGEGYEWTLNEDGDRVTAFREHSYWKYTVEETIEMAEKLVATHMEDVHLALDVAARSLRALGRIHAARLVEEVAGASDEAVVLALDELLGDQA